MNVSIVVLPVVAVLIMAVALVCLAQIRRPMPIALGSAIPHIRAVSWEEITEYYNITKATDTHAPAARTRNRHRDIHHCHITRQYISQMIANAKLFQQVARFEILKIPYNKSSLDYSQRESLALRFADEAAAVRWLLVKGQTAVTVSAILRPRIRKQALETLLHLTVEYKQLEQDAVALVHMASDHCYYAMLVERLGLSDWGLIHGGSSAS
jgi:hypothetical protein